MSRIERYEGPRDNTPHDEANCPHCQEDIAAMTAPTTPAQVPTDLIDRAVACGRIFERYEDPRLRPLSEENFQFYNGARKELARLTKQLTAALQSQLSNEQLVAQHYKESCDILRERAEAAQQAVAEREARIAVIYDGHRVLTEVKRNAKAAGRTSPENVSDVLDAIARIWKEPT